MKKLAMFLAAATVASSVVAIPSAAVADIAPSDKVLMIPSIDDIEIDGIIDGAYMSSYRIEHVWQDYKDGDPNNTADSNWNHWESGIYAKKMNKLNEDGTEYKDENGATVEIENPDYTPYPYNDPEKGISATSYFLWSPDGYLYVAIDVHDPTMGVVSDAKYEAECLNTGAPYGPWLQDQVMPRFGIDIGGQMSYFDLSAERGGRYAHKFSTGESWALNWRGWNGHEDNYDLDALWATSQRDDGYTVELVIPVDLDQANFNELIGEGPAFGDGYNIFYSLIAVDAIDLGTGDDDWHNYALDPGKLAEGIIECGTCFANFTNMTSGQHQYGDPTLKLTLSKEAPAEHEHTWTVVEGTNTATCTEKGTQKVICEVCGLESAQETEMLPHTWADEKTVDLAPSCIAEGSKSIHCTVCGAIDPDSIEVIPALGGQHTYDPNAEKVVDKEATCEEKGQKSIHCEVCGFPVEETIEELPALGHDMGEAVVVDPTCTKDGSSTKSCTREGCDHKEVEVTAALGHDLGEAVVVAPTCTEDGSSTRTCSRCDHKEVEVIAALGHKYGDAVVVDATCTEAGTSTVKCEICGHEEVTIIAALGHDFVDGVCTRCGAEEEKPGADGDVNGDGIVNSKDLTRLMKYIAGDPNAKLEGSGDINGDGTVNSKDLTRLMKVIAGVDSAK